MGLSCDKGVPMPLTPSYQNGGIGRAGTQPEQRHCLIGDLEQVTSLSGPLNNKDTDPFHGWQPGGSQARGSLSQAVVEGAEGTGGMTCQLVQADKSKGGS